MLLILRVTVLTALLCATCFARDAQAQTSEPADNPSIDENAVELLSRKAASFRRVIATLEADVQEAEKRLQDAYTQLQKVQGEHSQLLKELENLRRDEADVISKTEESRAELNDLLAEIDKSRSELTASNEAAEAKQADLNSARDAVVDQTKAATAELADLTAARELVLEQTKAAKAERDTLQAGLTQLQKTHDDLNNQIAESDEARQTAEKLMQGAQKARDEAIAEHDAMKSEIRAAQAERDAIAASAEVLRTQLEAFRTEKDETLAALDLLKAELEEATAPAVAEPAPEDADPGAADRRKIALQPARITRAIAAAPGLEQATPQERNELQRLLANGVCTHDALEAVFITINRQTLVSLIRDLGRC